MGFIPSSGCVNITVGMHHIDTDKMYREKARCELYKKTTRYIEKILKATPHETAVQPLTSHLKNHPSKTNTTCRTLLGKQEWTYE